MSQHSNIMKCAVLTGFLWPVLILAQSIKLLQVFEQILQGEKDVRMEADHESKNKSRYQLQPFV